MYTHSELLEVLGEGELASVSATFWLHYNYRTDLVSNITNTPKAYDDLRAFQNGWLACKEFYKIQD